MYSVFLSAAGRTFIAGVDGAITGYPATLARRSYWAFLGLGCRNASAHRGWARTTLLAFPYGALRRKPSATSFERECRISCSNDEYRKQNKASTKRHVTPPIWTTIYGNYFLILLCRGF